VRPAVRDTLIVLTTLAVLGALVALLVVLQGPAG
jgi:hypothetical protein